MGATSIYGSFISSDPYMRLITECYKDQVDHNFNGYTGSIGMIFTFREEKLMYCLGGELIIDSELEDFISKNPSIKTKEQAIEEYLWNNVLHFCDTGELVYAVDKSTVAGYEVTTYGGYREVHLNTVDMDEIERYIDRTDKGYTVFKLSQQRAGLSVGLKPELKGETKLSEIENKVKRNIIRYNDIYFAVKNNGSKVYMFAPNIKLQKNKVKGSREAHPVYYVGMACI